MSAETDMAEMPTVEFIEQVLSDESLYGDSGSDMSRRIAKILLFSAWVGEQSDQLAIVSGTSLSEVKLFAETLKKNGVFGKGIDHYKDYFQDENSGMILLMDAECGMNSLTRSTREDGESVWKMTEDGLESVEREILTKPEAQLMMDELDKTNGLEPGTWRKSLNKRTGA